MICDFYVLVTATNLEAFLFLQNKIYPFLPFFKIRPNPHGARVLKERDKAVFCTITPQFS